MRRAQRRTNEVQRLSFWKCTVLHSFITGRAPFGPDLMKKNNFQVTHRNSTTQIIANSRLPTVCSPYTVPERQPQTAG